jgi:hypothetical protein
MWGSIRRGFNHATGRMPKTSTEVALEKISDSAMQRYVEWPFTPTMEDIALNSDDPKVKSKAIFDYDYHCPDSGASKVVNIALSSRNPAVQASAIDYTLLGRNYWNTRQTIGKITIGSENPEVAVHALEAISKHVDDYAERGFKFRDVKIKELTSLSLDIVSAYVDDERVQKLTQGLVSKLNAAVPEPEYNNPYI